MNIKKQHIPLLLLSITVILLSIYVNYYNNYREKKREKNVQTFSLYNNDNNITIIINN